MKKFLLAGLVLPLWFVAHAAQPVVDQTGHVIKVGQTIEGKLASGSQRSMIAYVPMGHVIQGALIGHDVALDLVDADGRHMRRLGTANGIAQPFMWLATSEAESLVLQDMGSDAGNFRLELTRSLATIDAPAAANLPGFSTKTSSTGRSQDDALLPASPTSPRLVELERYLGQGGTTDAFWREVQGQGAPLVEPLDDKRSIVTFLWRGARHNVKLFGAPSVQS